MMSVSKHSKIAPEVAIASIANRGFFFVLKIGGFGVRQICIEEAANGLERKERETGGGRDADRRSFSGEVAGVIRNNRDGEARRRRVELGIGLGNYLWWSVSGLDIVVCSRINGEPLMPVLFGYWRILFTLGIPEEIG
ncbi:hypothetical protein U1Q18_021174 [Sarracenia purpurea var. burkii]